MKFSTEHRFPAPAGTVAALLVDPEFAASLALPDLSAPEIVEHRIDGSETVLRLRYEFVGSLDPIAKRVLGGQHLTWVQELTLDSESRSGRLRFIADTQPERLRATAAVALRDEPDGSVRTIAGEFVVRVPLIGGTAERKILPGVVRRLDVEADGIRTRLRTLERE
ncbi:MAG: DUF2505 family protein [Actinomycetota bacterium]